MKPTHRPATVTELRRQKMVDLVAKPLPPRDELLQGWQRFADEVGEEYAGILELFDSIPKFLAGSVTSKRLGKDTLPVFRRPFRYNENNCEIQIKPVIIELDKEDGSGEQERKEVIAGEREETLWRVLRKMASDKSVRRGADASPDGQVFITFTLHELRKRLEQVNRGWKWNEIKEALQVLAETPLKVRNVDKKLEIYSGPYIRMEYVRDETDVEGTRMVYKVYFPPLATLAIVHGLYNRINHNRLMALRSSLAQWLYETMVRQFRQATVGAGYRIQLTRIVREGPLRPYKEIRNVVVKISRALDELTEQDVLSHFPRWTKEVTYRQSSGGRPAIEDVTFTMYPSENVVKDIKRDNAMKSMREQQLALL